MKVSLHGRKVLLGYSEDEERDDHGRWVGDGGTDDDAGAASTDATLRADQAEWGRSLTPDEHLALGTYQSDGALINGYLRTGTERGDPITPDTKEWLDNKVALMDSAIGKATLTNDVETYRRYLGGSLGEGTAIGDVVEDKGYLSTTLNRDFAESGMNQAAEEAPSMFGSPVDSALVRISVPAGSPAAYLPASPKSDAAKDFEQELLLPRSTSVEITGQDADGTWVGRVTPSRTASASVLLGYSEDEERDERGRWVGPGAGRESGGKGAADDRVTDGVAHSERTRTDARMNDRQMNLIAHEVGREDALKIEAHRVIGGHEVAADEMAWSITDAGNWGGFGTYGTVGLDKSAGERWYGETNHGREYVGGPRAAVTDVLEKSNAFSTRVRVEGEGRRVLLAYSEDQPRDDHGRWGEGGGYAPEGDVKSLDDALDYYHTPASFDLNARLRSGEPLTDRQADVVRELDSGFTPAPNDLTVYRGVTDVSAMGVGRFSDDYGGARALNHFKDDGYMSTSLVRDDAENFAFGAAGPDDRPVMMELHVPAGTPILEVPAGDYGDQHEILLPRGTAASQASFSSMPGETPTWEGNVFASAREEGGLSQDAGHPGLTAAGARTVRRTGSRVQVGKPDSLQALQKASKAAAKLEARYRKAVVAALEELADVAAEGFQRHATDTLTAAGRPPTQCMIAVYPRPEEAAAIALPGGHPSERLHVSLAIMDMKDVDLDRDSLREAVLAVAASHTPLSGEVGGAGVFDRGWKGHPQILMPDVPGLSQLREQVVRELRQAGFPFEEVRHGFNPHLTVSYSDTPTVVGEDRIGLPLHFDHLGFDHDGRCDLIPFGTVTAALAVAYADAQLGHAARTLAAYKKGEASAHDLVAAVTALQGTINTLRAEIASAEKHVKSLLDAPAPEDPVAQTVAQQNAQSRVDEIRQAKDKLDEAVKFHEKDLKLSALDRLGLPDWAQNIITGGEVAADVIADEPVGPLARAVGLGERASTLAEVGNVASWASMLPLDEVLSAETIGDVYATHANPVRQAIVDQFQQTATDDLHINWHLTNAHVGAVLDKTGAHIKGIADTTRRDVEATISRAYREGLSIPDTADFIRRSMVDAAPARARMIARTEMNRLVQGGSLALMDTVSEATGEKYSKIWMTAPGAEYPRHEDYDGLNGQTVGLDELFDVGEDQLDYPGDPDGSPGETINCRCTLRYQAGSPAAEGNGGASPESASVIDTTLPEAVTEVAPAALTAVDLAQAERATLRTPQGLPWPREAPLLSEQYGVAKEILHGNPDLQHLYMAKGGHPGQYNRETRQWQLASRDKFLKEGTDRRGIENPELRATFLAGGSASGKSFLYEDLKKSGRLKTAAEHVYANADLMKEESAAYRAIMYSGDQKASSYAHELSSDMAKELTASAIERKSDFVLDGVGGGAPGKFLDKIAKAKEKGYVTQVELADVPVELAIARAEDRALDPKSDSFGRHVDPNVLIENHREVAARFLEWRDSPLVDGWRLWANENIGQRVLVAERVAGKTIVHEPARYEQFLAKAEPKPAVSFEQRLPTAEPVADMQEALRRMSINTQPLNVGETAVRDHLQMMADAKGANTGVKDWKYSGSEALTLDKGRYFEAQPYPDLYRDGIGELKRCYTNAWKLAVDHPELTYVEGWAQPKGLPFPVAHAWTVDKLGRVIDPTWPDVTHGVYFGVPLNTKYVTGLYLKKGTDTVFDWRETKIFQNGLSPDAQKGVPRALGRREATATRVTENGYPTVVPPIAPTENGVFQRAPKLAEGETQVPPPPSAAPPLRGTTPAELEQELHARYPGTEFKLEWDHPEFNQVISDETAQGFANTYVKLAEQFPEAAAKVKFVGFTTDTFEAEEGQALARTFPSQGRIILNPRFFADDVYMDYIGRVGVRKDWWPASYKDVGAANATLAHEFGHMVNGAYWPKYMVLGEEKAAGGEAALARKMFGTGYLADARGYAATSPYEAFAETFQMMVDGPAGLEPYQLKWVEGMRKELATKGVAVPEGGVGAFAERAPDGIIQAGDVGKWLEGSAVPQPVYHTTSDAQVAAVLQRGGVDWEMLTEGSPLAGKGFYAASTPSASAEKYGRQVQVALRFRDPWEGSLDEFEALKKDLGKGWHEELTRRYDGVIVHGYGFDDPNQIVYVALRPEAVRVIVPAEHVSFDQKLPPSAETFGVKATTRLEETNGFSLDAYGNPPTAKRYISALGTEHEVVLLPGNATARQLAEYAAEKQAVVNENPGSFLGGWKEAETGKTYLDVSTSFADQEEALRFAGSHGQKEIFDSQTGKSVKVPAAYFTETRTLSGLEGMLGAKEPRLPIVRIADVPKPPDWENWLTNAGTTSAERKALYDYTGWQFEPVNDALRGLVPMTAEIQGLVDRIDAAIARAPKFTEPVTVWRRIWDVPGTPSAFEFLGRKAGEPVGDWAARTFTPGEIIVPGGFQSTTFAPTWSTASDDIVFEIRTDHGALLTDERVSHIPMEKELLLGSNTRYRVLRVLKGVKFEREPGNFAEHTVVQVEAI